jgi:hypothetical protein
VIAVGDSKAQESSIETCEISPCHTARSGGLVLLRRVTPLPRRNAVYFRSGAYSCHSGNSTFASAPYTTDCRKAMGKLTPVLSIWSSSAKFATRRRK